MGHADPPDSFAESRCFIYNWFYSHLLHACFEEAQGFWLKKDLQLSNTIFISDALQQHLHLNLKLHFAWCFQQQLADKCLHDSEVWGLQIKAAPFSWAEVGNSPNLPVPTLMLKGDALRSVAARSWRPQYSFYVPISIAAKSLFSSMSVICSKFMIALCLEGTLSILPSAAF